MSKIKETTNEFLNELVPVFLIKDDYRYTDDVTVTYNGKNYLIKRGQNVMVPRFIKLVIDDSQYQKNCSMEFSKNLAQNYVERNQWS